MGVSLAELGIDSTSLSTSSTHLKLVSSANVDSVENTTDDTRDIFSTDSSAPTPFQQLLWAKVFEYGIDKLVRFADPVVPEDYILFDHTIYDVRDEDLLSPSKKRIEQLKKIYKGASPLLVEKGVFPLATLEKKEKEERFIPRTWRLGSVPFGEKDANVEKYVVGIVGTDLQDGTVAAEFYIQDLYDEPLRLLTQERVIGMWGEQETVVRVTFTKEQADQITFSHIIEPAVQEVTLFAKAA